MMSSRSWSDLPHELAKSIGDCLDTKTDVSRFRAVCKSWRSSISPFEKHLRFPINGCLEKVQGYACNFILSQSVVYHLAPPEDPASDKANPKRGWLIKVEEEDDQLGKSKTQLLHPLSQFFVKQLPKSFPEVINSLEFRVSELARMYRFDHPGNYHSLGCYKAAVSVDLNFPAVMVVSKGILYHGELELGVGNNIKKGIKVSKLRDDGDYKDVIFFQGKFYAVCEDGTTITVDSNLNVTTVASPMLLLACSRDESKRKYLVESLGDLLLIDRCRPAAPGRAGKYEDYVDVWMSTLSSEIKLKVFKLNADEKQWAEVNMKALNDRILIVGDDGSFSVAAKDFPGCSGNNIYFSTIYYEKYSKRRELEGMFNEIGVFRIDLGTHMPLLYYTSDNIFEPPRPTAATRTLLPCSRKRKGEDQTTNLDLVAQQTQQKKPRRQLGGLAAVRLIR